MKHDGFSGFATFRLALWFVTGNTGAACNPARFIPAAGINSCNFFYEAHNYEYFKHLFDKYISDVAETYALVLMPNHFHFVLRVKEEPEMMAISQDPAALKPPHQYFYNLFNAYTKAFNERFIRHGSLDERPFKRKLVVNEQYLKQLILTFTITRFAMDFVVIQPNFPGKAIFPAFQRNRRSCKGKKLLDGFKMLMVLQSLIRK